MQIIFQTLNKRWHQGQTWRTNSTLFSEVLVLNLTSCACQASTVLPSKALAQALLLHRPMRNSQSLHTQKAVRKSTANAGLWTARDSTTGRATAFTGWGTGQQLDVELLAFYFHILFWLTFLRCYPHRSKITLISPSPQTWGASGRLRSDTQKLLSKYLSEWTGNSDAAMNTQVLWTKDRNWVWFHAYCRNLSHTPRFLNE